MGPLGDKTRLSAVPVLPRVAPPAISGTSEPSGLTVKKKAWGQNEGLDPTAKETPGGQIGGIRKPPSEVGEVGMMGLMGVRGLSADEELASSEVVGLAEVVPQSRMRRGYARRSSPTLGAPLLLLLGSGMPAGVNILLPVACRHKSGNLLSV